MFNIVVCIKQVPMVSELPWDSKTGTLKRELAQGMTDPSSRRALEAALVLKAARKRQGGKTRVSAMTMGPPMAAEILFQAMALGADKGVLLTDRKMAGADTFLTSHILARCIKSVCPNADLVLCGAQSSDSETAQVGPQLAGDLDIPCIGYATAMEILDPARSGSGSRQRTIRVKRHVDDFMEELEMDLPGVVTVDHSAYDPRYLAFGGIEAAFERSDIHTMGAEELGLEPDFNALKDSPTRIIDVYSPTAQKENRILKGSVKTILEQLFKDYGKIISGALGRDLKTHEHGEPS